MTRLQAVRHQWDEGKRRLANEGENTARSRHLDLLVGAVIDELRKRIGQTFTLGELAGAYEGADDWVREVIVSSARPRSSIASERARERRARSGRRVLRWSGGLLVLAFVFYVGLVVGMAIEDNGKTGDQTLVRTLLPTTLTPRETVTVTVSKPCAWKKVKVWQILA